MAALCTIAKTCKQTKHMRTGARIKKIGSGNTVEYYSAMNKHEIMAFPAMGKQVEMIIQSEVSETGKHKYHMISLTRGI